jgi:hypothetical protein
MRAKNLSFFSLTPVGTHLVSRWEAAVKDVALSFRGALWPNLTLVDRTWVMKDEVRDALYQSIIGIFENGAEMAAGEAVGTRERPLISFFACTSEPRDGNHRN